VVSALAIGTKVREFKPGRGQWIQIRSTTSFGGEVKPAVPCRKILWHVKKNKCEIRVYLSPSFSCFAARCICWLLLESFGG
jgi:hypothetical protein